MKSIILAGGVGTRLWPLSREHYPKQFIQLDEKSLFQRTYERSLHLSGSNDIFVVTSEIHKYLVQNQVEELGHTFGNDQLLVEPAGKNTLPAIAWAMQRIRRKDGDGTAVVFPSDHILGPGATDQIRAAMPLARNHLVTFGIRPSCPHTGYGYIKPGDPVTGGFVVDAFREKPDETTAAEYVRNGYLWNSGIFLLSTGCFFDELEQHQPALATAFSAEGDPDYSALPSISIDYGLLELSQRVAVVPLQAEWSDLGTFRALYDHEPHDADSNVGSAEYLAAHGNYVHAPGKHIGMIGVDNLVVVDTADALLICDSRATERVKELVGRYNSAGDPVTRFHRQVHRPWGSYTILENGSAYKIKRVTVKAGERLSLQLHHHRSEHWIVVHGTAEMELDGETRLLRKGESTFVRAGALHRLKNPGVIPLEVIEVQLGEYLEEDDIVRFDDQYGRT